MWRQKTTLLGSHANWIGRLEAKNRQQGTSAPTLAAAWAGIVELYGALSKQPALEGFVIEELVIEAQATVDAHSGGRRNHDLVARGRVADGKPAVVCVEAKAGEPLGNSISTQRIAAAKAYAQNPRSNAPARVEHLVERFLPGDHAAEAVDAVRYQLLTALAGTISEAIHVGAKHAVLLLHDFHTDQRSDDAACEHDKQLRTFSEVVFGRTPPPIEKRPWCIEVGSASEAPGMTLYLAHAVTDLTTEALEAGSTS